MECVTICLRAASIKLQDYRYMCMKYNVEYHIHVSTANLFTLFTYNTIIH